MGIYDQDIMQSVARRSMTVFFLVDTSGSMYGAKIGTLNLAVEETIPELKTLSASNADAQTKVAVLKFDTDAEWITPAPVDIESFQWTQLNAGGLTAFGDACFKLEQKLHKEAFMSDAAGNYAPVFILLSDGAPTDDFKVHLDKLKNNNWFKKGVRVAIAIGDDTIIDTLEEFTGSRETVLSVYSPEMLRKIIRFVSVTASQVASKSSNVGQQTAPDQTTTKQQDFIYALNQSSIMQPADDGSDLGQGFDARNQASVMQPADDGSDLGDVEW